MTVLQINLSRDGTRYVLAVSHEGEPVAIKRTGNWMEVIRAIVEALVRWVKA